MSHFAGEFNYFLTKSFVLYVVKLFWIFGGNKIESVVRSYSLA